MLNVRPPLTSQATFSPRTDLLSWGRVERPVQFAAEPSEKSELVALASAGAAYPNRVLACGLGRSYGDTNLNADGAVITGASLDRILSFDADTGLLHAEAGVSLAAIIEHVLPHGFFLPVTPGTKFVTLAGAIANDVHGKNHLNAGTFGRHVEEIGLLRTSGCTHCLRPADASELFAATFGGLGLTGIITDATIRLKRVPSAALDAETVPFGHVREFFALSAESFRTHEYTVAWIDCLARGGSLGRGIFTRANHAAEGPLSVSKRKGPSMPFEAPGFLLNRFTIGAMNTAYFHLGRHKAGRRSVPYDSYFYPLDGVRHWNRFYGRRGMYQYQSVVPPGVAEDATAEMLRQISAASQGSFLVVLKSFGALPSPGMLSFPREGTTLALDFPNRGHSTLALLSRLDAIVREAGGRLYPAKDGRLPAEMFREGFPRLEEFRGHCDPGISSSFWRRMG